MIERSQTQHKAESRWTIDRDTKASPIICKRWEKLDRCVAYIRFCGEGNCWFGFPQTVPLLSSLNSVDQF